MKMTQNKDLETETNSLDSHKYGLMAGLISRAFVVGLLYFTGCKAIDNIPEKPQVVETDVTRKYVPQNIEIIAEESPEPGYSPLEINSGITDFKYNEDRLKIPKDVLTKLDKIWRKDVNCIDIFFWNLENKISGKSIDPEEQIKKYTEKILKEFYPWEYEASQKGEKWRVQEITDDKGNLDRKINTFQDGRKCIRHYEDNRLTYIEFYK